jgi:hypothetical protein
MSPWVAGKNRGTSAFDTPHGNKAEKFDANGIKGGESAALARSDRDGTNVSPLPSLNA